MSVFLLTVVDEFSTLQNYLPIAPFHLAVHDRRSQRQTIRMDGIPGTVAGVYGKSLN
jgi:hypothetical protein